MGYWSDIKEGFLTTMQGLSLSFRHIKASQNRRMGQDITSASYFSADQGTVTLDYPMESIPIPDHGRYRLDLEMDDCIVCDKCAKVCPVDCIDIEPIKSTEQIGVTSDGTSKRLYAAKFDIDMAKCCYCGLCTTVCPTECLTMTKTYDYSEWDVKSMNYQFATLTPAEAEEKKKAYEQAQALKAKPAAPLAETPVTDSTSVATPPTASTPKPAFKPMFKPTIKKNDTDGQ